MKKLLIATAALAMVSGVAHAQSSVTIYGILDAGYSSKTSTGLKYKASTNTNSTSETKTSGIAGNGAESTSRLGFRGTEDLGGGLKANFVFETGLNPAESTLTAMNTRQAFVGLEGGFGSVTVGTVYSAAHSLAAGFSASTLPNVVGDVMYVQSGGSLGGALSTFGITAKGTTLATLTTTNDATAYGVATAAMNTALIAAKLATNNSLTTGAAAATPATDSPTAGNRVVVTAQVTTDAGTILASNAGANQAIAVVQGLLDTAATTALNTRLARASNISYNVRTNNTVTYMSPDMSGFKLGGQYSLPTQTKLEGGDETTSSATQLSVNYAAGKFAAAAVHTTGESKSITTTGTVTVNTSIAQTSLNTITTAVTDAAPAQVRTLVNAVNPASAASTATVEVKTKESIAALSYDLGVAKVSYIYAKRNAKDTVSDLSEKTTHSFGVKAPFGKTTVFAIYSMGDTKMLEGTANAAKFDLDGTQMGVSYAMSKRTDIYGIYGTNKMDNVANANDIKDKQYAVGIRHSF